MIKQIIVAFLALAFAFALVACGGSPATSTGAKSYIAKLDGAPASARVGIVVEDGKFAAYVCSLDDAFNLTSARWYTGQLDANGGFQGTSPDGVEFKGTAKGDQFTGTLVNTAKKSMAFSGSVVPVGNKVGLYRGEAKFGGQDVIVGAVISADGSFASTVQYKGAIKFVTPIGSEPAYLANNTLGVKLGSNAEQATTTLVTTLKGLGF